MRKEFLPHPHSLKAFTLSEVLITLVIIGVVVAVTIPVLSHQHRNMVLQNQFKHAHSVLSQAVNMLQMRYPYWYDDLGVWINDDKTLGLTGNGAAGKIGELLQQEFNKLNSTVKTNKRDYSRQFSKYYKNRQNTSVGPSGWGALGYFDTTDGMTIYPECSGGCKHIHFFVDINGVHNKPNRQGYDLFDFQIDKKTGNLIPATQFGTKCNRTDTYSGFDCTTQALSDNDYFKKL